MFPDKMTVTKVSASLQTAKSDLYSALSDLHSNISKIYERFMQKQLHDLFLLATPSLELTLGLLSKFTFLFKVKNFLRVD